MSLFETAVGSLLAAIDDAHSNAEDMDDLARCVSAHRAGAPADALALRLPDVPLGSLGVLALTCGTLVEQGDPAMHPGEESLDGN